LAFYYKLIQMLAKKVFLLEYFDYENAKELEQDWVNDFYKKLSLDKKELAFLGIDDEPLTNKIINKKENEYRDKPGERAERILRIQYLLTPAYDAMWNKLNSNERYVLYDFALDGFTNYRNVDVVYTLYQRGLIRENDQLELMNYSFRNYLLGKVGTKEIAGLEHELEFGSSWKTVKNIFFILFFAVMIFLFLTQQEVSNKILAILSGFATLVPLLVKLFDRNITDGGAVATKSN